MNILDWLSWHSSAKAPPSSLVAFITFECIFRWQCWRGQCAVARIEYFMIANEIYFECLSMSSQYFHWKSNLTFIASCALFHLSAFREKKKEVLSFSTDTTSTAISKLHFSPTRNFHITINSLSQSPFVSCFPKRKEGKCLIRKWWCKKRETMGL